MTDIHIGQKVNLLEPIDSCSWKMSKEVYEVVSIIPWSKELNDWCGHYIVRDSEGNEKEIREYECVYSPDYTKEQVPLISDFLYKNGVYSEVYTQLGGKVVAVHIEWGDWRHEHGWAKDLMGYLGYREVGNEVTAEDGSDCYSATHYFCYI